MTHVNMHPKEVEASARLGNRIAAKIAKGKPRSKFNSALRHAMLFDGHDAAITLASRLMGISTTDAEKHIANLARTKNIDIVSPHCK